MEICNEARQLRGLCCTSKIGEGIVKSRQREVSQELFP
jgi:hypothetical protein